MDSKENGLSCTFKRERRLALQREALLALLKEGFCLHSNKRGPFCTPKREFLLGPQKGSPLILIETVALQETFTLTHQACYQFIMRV